ncbi:hypothetical protein SLS62_009994 [Diatrype stigma]|uniref:Adenosine deaminase n=1 Tax=Diatrype stigma TaxID=117547 RepID=A0AAN9UBN4_9PEZI
MTYGALGALDPEWLAGLRFGAMRAEPLEHLYRHCDPGSPYEELGKANKRLLEIKGAGGAGPIGTFYRARAAFHDDEKLQRFLRLVPKGNFAHLHFNAYLPTDRIADVYSRALEDPVFAAADTTDFQALLRTARQPYGDLMDFPGGDLGSRADEAWPAFQGLTPRFKVPFMYERFWRDYLKAMFRDWDSHRVLHGELRHVFMQEQIIDLDGRAIDDVDEAHKRMLDIVRDEVAEAKKTYRGRVVGAKVIYCIPRMFQEKQKGANKDGRWSAEWHVTQYLKLAKWEEENRKDNKVLVAFDVVGREDKETDPNGTPMRSTADFAEELERLLRTATEQGLPANLALHAGEALDMGEGTMQRRNLEVLADLAKKYPKSRMRGAHLVGLEHDHDGIREPVISGDNNNTNTRDIMEDFKKNNVAAELCPISNEALGTSAGPRDAARRYTDKIMVSLCTGVSGDNPTYFGSTPTLELAYILFGSDKVDLYRLVALAHMSINSSYMTDEERHAAFKVVHQQIGELVEASIS